MTARPLSPAEAAIVARFDAAEPAPESWRPVGDGDGQTGLRDRLADGAWIRVANAFHSRGLFIDNGDVGHIARYLADALLPVVTAYAEQRARERAAEELRAAIAKVRAVYAMQCPAMPADHYVGAGAHLAHLWWEKVLGGELEDLDDRANALAADDRAGQL